MDQAGLISGGPTANGGMLCLTNATSKVRDWKVNPYWLFDMKYNQAIWMGGVGFAGAPSDIEIASPGQQ